MRRLNLIHNVSNSILHLVLMVVSLLAATLANSSTLLEANEHQEDIYVWYFKTFDIAE